jgi:hypothetical protein
MDSTPRRYTKHMIDVALVDYFTYVRENNIPMGDNMRKLPYEQLKEFFENTKYLEISRKALAAMLSVSEIFRDKFTEYDLLCYAYSQLIIAHPPARDSALVTTLKLSLEDAILVEKSIDANKHFCDVAAMILECNSLKNVKVRMVNEFGLAFVCYLYQYDKLVKRSSLRM